MRPGVLATRCITLGLCLLVLAAACSSGHGNSNASGTTTTTVANGPTSTTDPDNTPNSIPYVPDEKIGLPNGWRVTITAIHKAYSAPGLKPVAAPQQYIALDITMENDGTATHTVNANALFTMVDTSHKSHFVVPEPGHANGIDGSYPMGTIHSGRIVFVAPDNENLGLILYGPRIGTQVSYFTIVPPTVPDNSN